MAANATPPPTNRRALAEDLRRLGLRPGDTVMVHASLKAIGPIVGGPDMVHRAILDAVGPQGTMLMVVGWAESTYHFPTLPPAVQRAVRAHLTGFDPATARSHREVGVLAECFRSWPGVRRGSHPDSSFAADGRLADRLTADQPLNDGYGPGSPLDKLCAVDGRVLLLGSPFDSVTLLHHAEILAEIPDKRRVRYPAPMLENGETVWIEIEDYDTDNGIVPWSGPEHYFACIVQDFIAAQPPPTGSVGTARAHVLDARALVAFAVEWMERRLAPSR